MSIESSVVKDFKGGKCRCCGRRIKVCYGFCIGCERKRMKIVNDCVGAGMTHSDAWAKAEAAYPQVFE